MEEVRVAISGEKQALVGAAAGAESSSNALTMGRVVRKKTARKGAITTVFELYNEQTDEYLLSCVAQEGGSEFIFTTLRDLDQRDISQLVISQYSASFLGALKGRGLGGLTWVLFGDDMRTRLCVVQFQPSITASPVQFQLHITSAARTRREGSGGEGSRGCNSCDINIRTKMPSWNTELQTFVHNFGCRVKLPSHRNFIALRVSTAHTEGRGGYSTKAAGSGRSDLHAFTASATIDHEALVCLRHGQVRYKGNRYWSCKNGASEVDEYPSSILTSPPYLHNDDVQVSANEYILDFRNPLSPLVAMATFCAVHAQKSLVVTGP